MSSYNFKVVLLGQGCVGKTSLVLRYVSNVFNDSHQSTLQAGFLKKQLYLEQDLVSLNLWDTAGQEKFHALAPIYYREADAAILVYDVTNSSSLFKVRHWVKELNKILGNDSIKLAIVGNKLDLLPEEQQQSPQTNCPLVEEAIKLTNELINAGHYLTSAKLNLGIGDIFLHLSRQMIKQWRKRHLQQDSRDTIIGQYRVDRPLAFDHHPQHHSLSKVRNRSGIISLNNEQLCRNGKAKSSCRC